MKLMIRMLLAVGALLSGTVSVASAVDLSGTAREDTLLWNCRVKGNGFTTDCHLRRTILSAAGHDFADISLSESRYRKIASFEARVYDANGREIGHARKKDLQKACGYGAAFILYSDNCSYAYEPQSSSFPYTVVYDYQIECNSLFLLGRVNLPARIPLTFASISVSFDPKYPIRYKAYRLDAPVQEQSEGDMTVATWTIRDLPAEPVYSYLPSEYLDQRRVCFAPNQFSIEQFDCTSETWKNLGLFNRQLNESRYLPLPANIQPPLSHEAAIRRADSLYRETVRQTHYVAVDIKMSGWQPEPAEKTQMRGYGDCKGLSILFISRLRAAGITAYPCLVLTNDEGAVDTSFVHETFNHVITMALIDRDTLWFDPTSHFCPPREIRTDDEGIVALVVTDTGGILAQTPVTPAGRNLLNRRAEIAINDSGLTVMNAVASLTGNRAQWARGSLEGETHEDTREFVKGFFVGGSATRTMDSCSVRNLDSLEAPVEFIARFSSTKPLDRIGGVRYLLPFVFTSRTLYEGLDLDKRSIPVNLQYPYANTDTVIVRTPWTVSADSMKLPPADSISFPGGWSTVKFTRDSTTIVGVFTQVFRDKLIPVEDFTKFSAFLAARKKILDQPIKWYVKAGQ